MKTVLFDVDGTLADNGHRTHFLQKSNPDWAAYNDRMAYDLPVKPIVELAQTLWKAKYKVLMVTGREERYRIVTLDWLDQRHIPCDGLFMRVNKDYRPDDEIKSELLDLIISMGYLPVLAVDDRSSVVAMWRKRGLVCLQCSEGNF